MESYSRIRSVKLKRPSAEHPFGFSVRGGHEHGTGIFVSFVDPRSLAYRQGLKVGDQILRVNGFPVSAAVHHECLSLMRIRSSLHLKVRSVGMLPVKEKTGDPLTWKLVEEQPSPPLTELPDEIHHNHHGHNLPNGGLTNGHLNSRQQNVNSRMSDTSSQPDSRTEFHHGSGGETKVFIDLSGQSGLGCCICKGPPERPGIFVQSTKSNGVAREAGLRPGDQVISCNGHSFLHIPFAEAVYYLKSSKHLNLRVVKGAASDLFPGESSGYNSSASSLNGDTNGIGGGGNSSSNLPSSDSSAAPSPADIIVHDHEQPNKRLSMVTEEIPINNTSEQSSTGRGSPNKRTLALDRNMEWDEVEQVWRKAEKETIVIEVKGQDPNEMKLKSEEERLQEERRKLEETQRRLLEEALRLEEDKRKFEEEKRRSLRKSPSDVSNSSSSTESANSLAGALNQEILKRNERRESNPPSKEDERPKPGTVEQKRTIFSNQIDQEKRQQHEQLIEEFKRAHRKMFAHAMTEDANKDGDNKDNSCGPSSLVEPVVRPRKAQQKEIDHERQMVAQRVAGIVRQRQLRIERQHQEVAETEREVSKHVINNKSPPPPPPPLPQQSSSDQNPSSSSGASSSSAPTPKVLKPLAPAPPIIAATLATKTVIIEEKGQRTLTPARTNSSSKGHAPPPPPPQRALEIVTANGMNAPSSTTTSASNQNTKQVENSNVQQNKSSDSPRRPESPSPDYSNSPSPIPSPPRVHRLRQIGVDMQSLESFRLKDPPRSSRKPPPVYFCDTMQQLVQANGQMRLSAYPANPTAYTRNDPRLDYLAGLPNGKPIVGKMIEPPTVPCMKGSESNIQRELEEALARCTMNSNNNGHGGEITSNGQGKVTIVLGENNFAPNSNRPNKTNSNGMKPNGGILKMGNSGHNGNNVNSNKTITFSGKY